MDLYLKTEEKKNIERNKLLKFLERVPEGKKVVIDSELLDYLIFTTNYAIAYNVDDCCEVSYSSKLIPTHIDYDKDGNIVILDDGSLSNKINLNDVNDIKRKGIKAKIPVWTGSFLRKIDLSEIDFDNVVWSPESLSDLGIIWGFDMGDIDYYLHSFNVDCILSDSSETRFVDFSGTNAKIDFSHSFDAKAFQGINSIINCNLSGIDLSSSHGESITYVLNSDLHDTGFEINHSIFSANNSNLSGLDMNGMISLYSCGDINASSYSTLISNSNVANTGLYIDVLTEDKKGINPELDLFADNIERGFFTNCKLHLITRDEIEYEDDLDDNDDLDNDDFCGFKL